MGVLNHLSTLLLLSLLPPALSHVVEIFSVVEQCQNFFLDGTTPNLPGILVGGTVQNHYKLICQLFSNIYRFATLYDTTNRIPVFSAYTFTGNVVGSKRPKNQTWMIEPQLEDIDIKEMKTQDDDEVKELNNNNVLRVNHQAADTDYKNNRLDLDRGHLFPCSYAPDDDAKRSTFTLTNAVPQERSFNGGSWRRMECKVRDALELNCKKNNKIEAYVVTGAVPSFNNTLKERVNIPDLMWTAYCCYNNNLKQWVAQAHWGENQKEDKGKKLPSNTLVDLYNILNQLYPGGDVQVFPDQCPTADIPRALPLRDGDVYDHCVYDDDCVCSSVGVKGYYLPVVLVSVLVMMM
ncbi:endonuclease domain-containing 1 protein-like isoform X1 [Salmo salar]|uniref:Endonuclease domain-containing 1 protein-like isoform X1 n=2 Tax=Salmo salar TaxID=8030 RepID=A0ABM3EE72_SALSA|nr:endonuclease domain-containing 1 protein-like isoform X1 [Salmo salar]